MMLVYGNAEQLARERKFFFFMSILIFLTVLIGFGSQVVAGRAWFTDFPWQVHVHAIVFSAWTCLYLVQNWLVANGANVGLHRRLGWLGAGIATAMVPLGIAATLIAIARGSITGIFPLGLFLALDVLHILGFGALTFTALMLRNHSDWHKRLMLCGAVLTTAPALSRLLGFLPLGRLTPGAVIAGLASYVIVAMVFDKANRTRVHSAFWWGFGTVAIVELSIVPLGFSPAVVAFATQLAN